MHPRPELPLGLAPSRDPDRLDHPPLAPIKIPFSDSVSTHIVERTTGVFARRLEHHFRRARHSTWHPPPSLAALQTVDVRCKEGGEAQVWVPVPDVRGTWTYSVAIFERGADMPNAPADWVDDDPIESIPEPPEQATGQCEP